MQERFSSPYFVIDVQGTLVRFTRTATPFPTLDEMERAFADAFVALDAIGRAGRVLFVDMRKAPGRNDPEFEAAVRKLRAAWLSGYTRVAVLMLSATGALQVHRYAREDGIERLITTQVDQLCAYLGISRDHVP